MSCPDDPAALAFWKARVTGLRTAIAKLDGAPGVVSVTIDGATTTWPDAMAAQKALAAAEEMVRAHSSPDDPASRPAAIQATFT